MISPFAPLYPWLLSAVMFDTPMCVRPNGQRARLVSIQRTRADGPTQYKFAEHRPTWTSETPDLDLRHGPTRYAVLRALADADHARPWALGAPWSPLTDEQASRAVAEILRAVGIDPKSPVGTVPWGVYGEWSADSQPVTTDGRVFPGYMRRFLKTGQACSAHHPTLIIFPDGYDPPPSEPRHNRIGWYFHKYDGYDLGEIAKAACDGAVRREGYLLLEDLTPVSAPSAPAREP